MAYTVPHTLLSLNRFSVSTIAAVAKRKISALLSWHSAMMLLFQVSV